MEPTPFPLEVLLDFYALPLMLKGIQQDNMYLARILGYNMSARVMRCPKRHGYVVEVENLFAIHIH